MRKTIIGAIALILALAVLLGLTLALAKSAERKQPGKIVWDAGRCALSWTGGNGEAFVIDFHKGTMTDGKKTYPLSQIEQAEVHEALNFFLSRYAVASEVWFEKGGEYEEAPGPVRKKPEAGEKL